MEYSAILHDMDKRFCYAIDKDLFVIRVQVKKDDIKEIILHYEDKLSGRQTMKTEMFTLQSLIQPTGVKTLRLIFGH